MTTTLAPDDPRHGTVAGYHGQGCRCTRCKQAAARYAKRRVFLAERGEQRLVPIVGFRRRLEALHAFGYPHLAIAEAMGITGGALSGKLRRPTVRIATHRRMAVVFDRLSVTPGPSTSSRARAAKKGWPPPFAWDDDTIDDPDAKPYQPRDRTTESEPTTAASEREHVDDVIVHRALNGQRVRANALERAEIARRWIARGGSIRELNAAQRWNLERDRRRADQERAA